MDDSKPNLEAPSPTGLPSGNAVRLEATNSPIGNVVQINASPGAVVSQVHEEQGSSAVAGILAGMFGGLLLLVVGVLPFLGKLVPTGLSIALVGLSFWLMVGGFFSWVESLLKNSTKSDVAGWIVGVKVGQKMEPWPETFAKVFDRLFGTTHFSFRCFVRSLSLSWLLAMSTIAGVVVFRNTFRGEHATFKAVSSYVVMLSLTNGLPDYISLLLTRFTLSLMRRTQASFIQLTILSIDAIGTFYLAVYGVIGGIDVYTYLRPGDMPLAPQFPGPVHAAHVLIDDIGTLVYPAFFTSSWLWLYAASGFLLKGARRFDIGFQWFNRRFDIEKKPLSSIGLVAGALVALVYWAAVIVSRVG